MGAGRMAAIIDPAGAKVEESARFYREVLGWRIEPGVAASTAHVQELGGSVRQSLATIEKVGNMSVVAEPAVERKA